MKSVEKKEIEKRKINWAIPGQTVTQEQFVESIREAEKGPFYSIEESKKMIEEWRKQRSSQ
ncbi:MAG: hypothetical protein K0M50_17545 [Prolixibacteraceae bacterium]|nr:hypothetical protein [Prolixibacteraceae bacterium]